MYTAKVTFKVFYWDEEIWWKWVQQSFIPKVIEKTKVVAETLFFSEKKEKRNGEMAGSWRVHEVSFSYFKGDEDVFRIVIATAINEIKYQLRVKDSLVTELKFFEKFSM